MVARSDKGTFKAVTDDFGDFWLRQLPDADWEVEIKKGDKGVVLPVSTRAEDQGLGDIPLD